MSTGWCSLVAQQRWYRRIVGGVTAEEVQRFDGASTQIRTELRSRRDRGIADPDRWWLDAAEAELTNAEAHRENFKLDAAWSALKAGERHMVGAMGSSELLAHARSARHQGLEKLNGWRRASVDELLPVAFLDAHSEPALDDLRNRTVMVLRMIDAHSDNVYHKYRLLRRAVLSTAAVLGCFLAALVATVALGWVPDALIAEGSPLGSWRLLCVVMCLGAIGAFLSSATELTGRKERPRIPDLRVDYTLMGMRPIVGAAGAVVVIVLLQSAFENAVSLHPRAILGVAIAAGFTERLVTRTITAAAGAARE